MAQAEGIQMKKTLEAGTAGWEDPILTWKRHIVFFVRSNKLHVFSVQILFENDNVFPISADDKNQLKKAGK